MRINGFEQIKAFYSWSFENQDKSIKPQHMSLYMFLVNQNNRNNWVEWFKLPFDLAMAGSCISSKKTYYSCLNDLQDWGLIEYTKGVNNWKAPLIKLEVLKDTSSVPQSKPQQEQLPVQADTPQHIQALIQASTPQPIPNIKLLTSNLKLITSNLKRLKDIISFAENYIILEEEVYTSHFEKTFNDFLEMRKTIKKPATERAVELLKNKLEKLSNGDEDLKIKIVEQSIISGWQDFFPLKIDFSKKEKFSAQKENKSKLETNLSVFSTALENIKAKRNATTEN